MKNSNEMVENLLSRRSEYIKKKQKRRKVLATAIPLCLCFAALAGVAIWQSPIKDSTIAGGENSTSSGIFTGHYWVPDDSDGVKGDPAESDKCATSKETLSKPIGPSIPYIDGNDFAVSSSPYFEGGDVRAVLIIDGITYDQSDVATQNADDYTAGECLGDIHELEGSYKQYDIKGSGKAYRTLESPDHLMIKLENGATIILKKEELK